MQHGADPKRELANCGTLRKAMVLDGHEFKPHRKGSWGQGPNQQWHAAHGMGHGAKSLTSISMLPPPLVKKCGVPGGPEPRAYAQSQLQLATHAPDGA